MSLVMLGVAKKGDKGRPESDFYETPVVATESLLLHENFSHHIWEPACGKGAISKVLIAHKYDVVSTDLYDHGYGLRVPIDFLGENLEDSFRLNQDIITNPPFSLSGEFLEQALSLMVSGHVNKFAFLLRLNFLEGQKRAKIFKEFPPARVLVFSKRLPMMHRPGYNGKKSTSTVAYAWMVWECGTKTCEVKWI